MTSSLPGVASLGPGGLSENPGSLPASLFPICSWWLLWLPVDAAPPRDLTHQAAPFQLPPPGLSQQNRLSSRKQICHLSIPDGTDTSTHSPFLFRVFYDELLVEKLTRTEQQTFLCGISESYQPPFIKHLVGVWPCVRCSFCIISEPFTNPRR